LNRLHPHLYEISAWPWLERLSGRAGRQVTLGNVPASEWDSIRDRGFDAVYLMGVWRRSALSRTMARTDTGLLGEYDRALPGWSMRDVVGSPFSVAAYEPDDRMGGWRGLDAARAELSRRGIALVLDFVTNHTSLDHEWISTRPDLYVEGTLDDFRRSPGLFHPVDAGSMMRFVACGRDPYFPPWRDVAQLNYFNPATREAMGGVLDLIAQHCDGVRCDMAMLVVNDVFARTWARTVDLLWSMPAEEFWPAAIARVPSLTFLAEVYWDRERQLQQQGFHFTYDKRLLDDLRQPQPAEIRGHLQADADYSARLVRFLENHDEARSREVFGSRVPAAAAIAYATPGMRFFFDGQFDGATIRPPVQLGRWFEEQASPEDRELYERLLRAIGRDIFHSGTWRSVEVRSAGDASCADLVAFEWQLGTDRAVVAANVSAGDAQGLLQIARLADGVAFDFVDQLTESKYRWARADLSDGLYVRLGSGAAHLFLVERAEAS
jgi:hypothetical protein